MRRFRIDEETAWLQNPDKDATPVCPICGTPLEQDDESGEYTCPVCDSADQP